MGQTQTAGTEPATTESLETAGRGRSYRTCFRATSWCTRAVVPWPERAHARKRCLFYQGGDQVHVHRPQQPDSVSSQNRNPLKSGQTATDENGRFVIERVTPHPYNLVVVHESGVTFLENIDTREGAKEPSVLLQPPTFVEGRLPIWLRPILSFCLPPRPARQTFACELTCVSNSMNKVIFAPVPYPGVGAGIWEPCRSLEAEKLRRRWSSAT